MDHVELVRAVRAHAVENYEKSGWDYVVECFEDSRIIEIAGTCRSTESAIQKIGKHIKDLDEYRKDIQGTAW